MSAEHVNAILNAPSLIGDISRFFSRNEVTCKCGCGFDSLDVETHDCLVLMRAHFVAKYPNRKVAVNVTSGCRCFAWNDYEGGADDSYHMKARAVDFWVSSVPVAEVYGYLVGRYTYRYGIGLYRNFIHFDTRTAGMWRRG